MQKEREREREGQRKPWGLDRINAAARYHATSLLIGQQDDGQSFVGELKCFADVTVKSEVICLRSYRVLLPDRLALYKREPPRPIPTAMIVHISVFVCEMLLW